MSRLGCVQAQKRSVIGARRFCFSDLCWYTRQFNLGRRGRAPRHYDRESVRVGLASHHFSLGPTDMEGPGRVRATALIEDIWSRKFVVAVTGEATRLPKQNCAA